MWIVNIKNYLIKNYLIKIFFYYRNKDGSHFVQILEVLPETTGGKTTKNLDKVWELYKVLEEPQVNDTGIVIYKNLDGTGYLNYQTDTDSPVFKLRDRFGHDLYRYQSSINITVEPEKIRGVLAGAKSEAGAEVEAKAKVEAKAEAKVEAEVAQQVVEHSSPETLQSDKELTDETIDGELYRIETLLQNINQAVNSVINKSLKEV